MGSSMKKKRMGRKSLKKMKADNKKLAEQIVREIDEGLEIVNAIFANGKRIYETNKE